MVGSVERGEPATSVRSGDARGSACDRIVALDQASDRIDGPAERRVVPPLP